MALQADGLIFEISPAFSRTPVRFTTRYGVEIAANLYTAKNLDEVGTIPALVIGAPHGGVKEQAPGVYANQLAQRGFVALASDPSYNGESGGAPRHITSPELFAEDFSAGVDFLGTLGSVDRERIGAIGVCGSGGFALSAAQVDLRIKTVVTSAIYDISAARRLAPRGHRGAASRQAGAAGRRALGRRRRGRVCAQPGVPGRVQPCRLRPDDGRVPRVLRA
ncbi:alpha/beta hydrolase [Demequina maris]|uniref:alpha/beta hydrolase n=1 Tax=Demequina maris TaxID=1638982 RepID=UPI000A659E4F|nr:alpha/beta hydrolase [Demequina maris]